MSSLLSDAGFTVNSEVAQKVWKNFERELAHKLKPLPEEEREDIRLEILSHLYDSATNDQAASEELRLINAIDRLGAPDDYLTPLVADILLLEKTRKGHPLAILESFLITASRGLFYMLAIMVLGFAYFYTMMIFVMAVVHIGDPDVGLWLFDSGDFALSFETQPGAVQWQPKWFSLIAASVSVSSYWLLNKILAWLLFRTKTKIVR